MKNCKNFTELVEEIRIKLEELGYSPWYYDEEQDQLNCVINQSLLSFYSDDEDETLFGYGFIFEAKNPLTSSEIEEIRKAYNAEKTPFMYLHFDDELYPNEDMHCIHLVSDGDVRTFDDTIIDAIISTVNKTDGVVSLIKTKTYPQVEPCNDLADLLERAYKFLVEKGFDPYFYDDYKSQLNCEINGLDFSIYPHYEDDDVYTCGCTFRINEKLTEEEKDEIQNLLNNSNMKYLKNLNFVEDIDLGNDEYYNGIDIEYFGYISDYSDFLLEFIINSIIEDNDFIKFLKSKK